MIMRSNLIHSQVEELRKIKYFDKDLISNWEKQDYITDEMIVDLMQEKAENLRRLIEIMKTQKDKCADITNEEKKILSKLTEFGY